MPILNLNDTEKVAEYDNFIETSPYGHMMQARSWSDVKNNWEHDYVYTEDENGKINSALSILSVKNDGEHAFLYAPRGPVCDPTDIGQIQALLVEAQPVVEKHNAFLLRMDPEVRYSEELVAAYKEAGFTMRASSDDAAAGHHSNPPYNMIFYLDGMTVEDVMASYLKKHRSNIRRTYRDGLTTKMFAAADPEFPEALKRLNDLLQVVAEREDIALRNLDYLKRLTAAFNDVKIFETYHPDGEVLASGMVISYNKKSFYIYAGSSNTHRNMGASTQLNQEAIEYAISRGSSEYDMGGIFSTDPKSDGLYLFKRHFVRKDDYTRFVGEIDVVFNEEVYQQFLP
ncbi:lipid II:glycine glycyltransferase FemX [Enterococcus diestrammenae]|uniref:lipid II:glycine glycyltransferase FemX n=1 Tax=Enterococcus diestrammenae TaxID=1155073 RepID=UPI0022E4C4BF|nr:peptidoglycan bridge formation glycyltransferase FemA/FemB family protein [Enterococcus diestrammenae]